MYVPRMELKCGKQITKTRPCVCEPQGQEGGGGTDIDTQTRCQGGGRRGHGGRELQALPGTKASGPQRRALSLSSPSLQQYRDRFIFSFGPLKGGGEQGPRGPEGTGQVHTLLFPRASLSLCSLCSHVRTVLPASTPWPARPVTGELRPLCLRCQCPTPPRSSVLAPPRGGGGDHFVQSQPKTPIGIVR